MDRAFTWHVVSPPDRIVDGAERLRHWSYRCALCGETTGKYERRWESQQIRTNGTEVVLCLPCGDGVAAYRATVEALK